jgi:hypothetical protein
MPYYVEIPIGFHIDEDVGDEENAVKIARDVLGSFMDLCYKLSAANGIEGIEVHDHKVVEEEE